MVPSIRKRVRKYASLFAHRSDIVICGIEISCKSLYSAPIYEKAHLQVKRPPASSSALAAPYFSLTVLWNRQYSYNYNHCLRCWLNCSDAGPICYLCSNIAQCCTQCSLHGVHDLGLYGSVFIACGENSITFQTRSILKTDPYYCGNCTFICKSLKLVYPQSSALPLQNWPRKTTAHESRWEPILIDAVFVHRHVNLILCTCAEYHMYLWWCPWRAPSAPRSAWAALRSIQLPHHVGCVANWDFW